MEDSSYSNNNCAYSNGKSKTNNKVVMISIIRIITVIITSVTRITIIIAIAGIHIDLCQSLF